MTMCAPMMGPAHGMKGINLHHVSLPAAQLGNGSMHDGTSWRYIQQPQCLYKASVLM